MIQDLPLKVNYGIHVRGQGQRLDLVLIAISEDNGAFKSATLEVRGHSLRGKYQVELEIGKIVLLNEGLYVKLRKGNRGPLLSCNLNGYHHSPSREYNQRAQEYSTA